MKGIGALVLMLSTFVGTTQPPPKFDPEIRIVRLADQLYVLEGAGGNVAVFVWDEGVMLVG